MSFKIGIMVDSLRLGLRDGIRKAAAMGAQGIQIYAVSPDGLYPDNYDKKARKELLEYIHSNGLVVSALCGDMGGHGFGVEADNPEKIERTKAILDLALDLDCHVVTSHIGVIPTDKTDPHYRVYHNALEEIGQYGDKIGVCIAIETGPESPIILRDFIEGLDTNSVKVNLDPANLVMVTAVDPVEAVRILAPHIVHTHAKDGVQLQPCDPSEVYHSFAVGGVEGLFVDQLFEETPLGEGKVNFPTYLDALAKEGYDGFLTIEREVGDKPEEDVGKAVSFLKDLLTNLE